MAKAMPKRRIDVATWAVAVCAASAATGCSDNTTSGAVATDSGVDHSVAVAEEGDGGAAPSSDGQAGGDGPADGATLLIDDFSASVGTQIALDAGFPPGAQPGVWYNYDDGTGTMVPPVHEFAFSPLGVTVGDAGTFAKGACESGSGYVGYGAGWGMTFAMEPSDAGPDAGSLHVPYDASRWSGISFWAAIVADSGVETVTVGIPDIDTYSDYPGSTCLAAPPDASTCVGPCQCDNNFGREITLTTTWLQYQLDFAATAPNAVTQDPYWGYQVSSGFNPSKIFALQFQVDGPDMPDGGAKPVSFPTICVAQIEFYK
jgi:hypothetical protein